MPALEFPVQIRLSTKQSSHARQGARSTLANAPVLDLLLPQLFVPRPKQYKVLVNVDHYMLQETGQLCLRIEYLCQQLKTQSKLNIYLSPHNGQIEVQGDTADSRKLQQRIRKDSWITGAFRWLHPNYLMLAQSQELLAFSTEYQQAPQLAAEKYRHLALAESGMICCLRLSEGKVQLTLDSPLHTYQLEVSSKSACQQERREVN